MNYCQEIAVLQSALLLTNKQLKGKKKNSKSDIGPCVAVLYGAVQEICQGLEEDRELKEKETWGQQLFSILLYKVISTHYKDMVPVDDVGIKPGKSVDKMEALCAVLPPVNKKVFLEVIKRCGWYQLFFDSLILVQERVASSLLVDTVSYVCDDEIDNNDLTWGKLIINYFVGNLITFTKSSGRPSNKDEANQSDLLKAKPLDISSQAMSSQSTSTNGQESSNDNVRDICSTRGSSSALDKEGDVCGVMTLTDLCCALKQIIHCQNTANSQNLSELDNKNEIFCGLCQFLLLGVCFCAKSPDRFDQISDWIKSNVFGCDIHDQNLHSQSFGRYSCTTMLERDTGLDSTLMNTSSEVFPWKCWIEKIRNILNSETIQNITADIDNIKPLESTVSFCNFVPLVPKGVNSGKIMSQFLSLECSTSKVLTMAAQVLQGVQEFNRQTIDTDEEETLTFSKDLEIIIESLYGILKVSQPDVDRNVSFTSDWSLSAILWRVDNQRPGYKDGFSRLLTTFHTEVWSNLSLMKTIQDNMDVLLSAEVMPKFYDLVAKLFDDMDPDLVCQLKQLALAGFSCLPWTVQDQHIALVYSSYRHWPRHHGGQLDSVITTTLNKLTMEVTENEKVISELCQLALQDVETVIKGVVGRAASSAQQTEISIKVLMRMASVASGRTDGYSLCDVLHQYLESSQLSAKECRNILYFIQLSVQPQKSTDCGDTQRAAPLLNITRFIQNTALPYLSVSCISREETLNTVFALEIILCIIEALKHHKAVLDSVLECLAADSACWLLCVAELWQCCVILWESDLDIGVKLKLKENLVKFSTLLKSTNASCELCNSDPQSSDWLYGHLEQLDWSVQLCMAEVVSPKVYLQESEREKLCLVLSNNSGDYQDLFRAAAVSDKMMETVAKLLTKLESSFVYEEVVVCFTQMLPHFVYEEWKRVTQLTWRILDVGYLVPRHHNYNQGDMGTHTGGLGLLLNLSQLMHDIMLFLQFTTLVTVKAGLLHCTKCYVGVIKECVLAGGTDLTMLEQSILLTEVFNHICHATQWMMPLETLDPVDVLLLDLVCSLEQLKNDLDMNMVGRTFTDKLKCLTQSSGTVKNPDTKTMLEKKITGILDCVS